MRKIEALTLLKQAEHPNKKIGVILGDFEFAKRKFLTKLVGAKHIKRSRDNVQVESEHGGTVIFYKRFSDFDKYICGHRFDMILFEGSVDDFVDEVREMIIPMLAVRLRPQLEEKVIQEIGEIPKEWNYHSCPQIYFSEIK